MVQACFRSVRKNCTQELVVLDEKTLRDYITLPDIIWQKRAKGQIKNAHFADICRVELLYEHGGIWLDSTGFATAPIPDWIIKEDFFVYMAGQHVGSPYSFMQNCFIRARRGAYLLDAWRAMILDYWTHENHSFDYFMHQLLFKTLVMNDPRAKNILQKCRMLTKTRRMHCGGRMQINRLIKKFLMTSFQGHFFKKQPMPKQRIRQKAALLTL